MGKDFSLHLLRKVVKPSLFSCFSTSNSLSEVWITVSTCLFHELHSNIAPSFNMLKIHWIEPILTDRFQRHREYRWIQFRVHILNDHTLKLVILIQIEVRLLIGDLVNHIFHLFSEPSRFTTFNLVQTKSSLLIMFLGSRSMMHVSQPSNFFVIDTYFRKCPCFSYHNRPSFACTCTSFRICFLNSHVWQWHIDFGLLLRKKKWTGHTSMRPKSALLIRFWSASNILAADTIYLLMRSKIASIIIYWCGSKVNPDQLITLTDLVFTSKPHQIIKFHIKRKGADPQAAGLHI